MNHTVRFSIKFISLTHTLFFAVAFSYPPGYSLLILSVHSIILALLSPLIDLPLTF